METPREELLATIERMEAALVECADARTAFTKTLGAVNKAAYRQGGRIAVENIDTRVSVARVDEILRWRMRALGLSTLVRAGEATIGPEWVTTLSAAVRAVVPTNGETHA